MRLYMFKTKICYVKAVQFLYALIIGVIISVFPLGATTVQAAEPQANEAVMNEDMQVSEGTDDENNMVIILLGGMLVIIIAVVVVVAAVSALMGPVADEL